MEHVTTSQTAEVEYVKIFDLPKKDFWPKGVRCTSRTIRNWIDRGVNGVKLKTVLLNGRRYTTRNAFLEFFSAMLAAGD